MEGYNTKFIVVAFNVVSHLDWWMWNIFLNFYSNDDVILWFANTLYDKLGIWRANKIGDKASMEILVEWVHTWRYAELNGGSSNNETDYLVGYKNRNETWNLYCLCAICIETLGDYQVGLLTLPTIPLTISTKLSWFLSSKGKMYVEMHWNCGNI